MKYEYKYIYIRFILIIMNANEIWCSHQFNTNAPPPFRCVLNMHWDQQISKNRSFICISRISVRTLQSTPPPVCLRRENWFLNSNRMSGRVIALRVAVDLSCRLMEHRHRWAPYQSMMCWAKCALHAQLCLCLWILNTNAHMLRYAQKLLKWKSFQLETTIQHRHTRHINYDNKEAREYMGFVFMTMTTTMSMATKQR